jgi:hypothetical protein
MQLQGVEAVAASMPCELARRDYKPDKVPPSSRARGEQGDASPSKNVAREVNGSFKASPQQVNTVI